MDNKELPHYITRSVADIARKCHCGEYTVWLAMHMLSDDYVKKNRIVK